MTNSLIIQKASACRKCKIIVINLVLSLIDCYNSSRLYNNMKIYNIESEVLSDIYMLNVEYSTK